MSLYNALHGTNPMAGLLLGLMNLRMPGHPPASGTWPTGRFRDIHVNEDGTKVLLLTRNGGGNRKCWEDKAPGEHCHCPGCVQTKILPKHPYYSRDWDDDFDATYAYTEFLVPGELLQITRQMANGTAPKSLQEQFAATIEKMKGMSREELLADPVIGPLARNLMEVLGPVVGKDKDGG